MFSKLRRRWLALLVLFIASPVSGQRPPIDRPDRVAEGLQAQPHRDCAS